MSVSDERSQRALRKRAADQLPSAFAHWARRISYRLRPDAYWERRHQLHGRHLDGVGQIGLGQIANELDYWEKWKRLSELLDDLGVPPNRTAIDAGCGIGWFTERLVERGHQAHGVDFSSNAISVAREVLGDRATFEVSPLPNLTARQPADLVICVDVLFHIVENRSWSEALNALTGITSSGGLLVIQEHLVDATDRKGSVHVRWRTLNDYRKALSGWSLVQHKTYRLPQSHETKDLMAWKLSR